jgi:hypothetical protein
VFTEAGALEFAPTSTRMVAVRVRADPHDAHGSHPIEFVLAAGDLRVVEKSRFLVP